jgi:PPOX class probable F420-dependent enzyme
MPAMTQEEYLSFLTEGTKTGKLATVREDGRPHVVPIWFVLDGDNLIFTTGESSVKAKNMILDPRVSISVDDQTPPYSFVTVEGTVSLSENPDEMLYWATRIGSRYMGEEQAEAFGKRNAVKGELLVTITPSKVIAYKDVTAW